MKFSGEKKLSLYLTHGLYDEDTTLSMIDKLLASGVDFIEYGMPYSDPIADGPVIQESSGKAIANGATLKNYFPMAKKIVGRGMDAVFMGYYNQILQYGEQEFVKDCKSIGLEAAIIPDLPLEYAKTKPDLWSASEGLPVCHLVTPTTTAERVKEIDAQSEAFVYIVADNSITGGTGDARINQETYLERIQQQVNSPKMLGFGIRDAKTASLSRYTDGVIVGSAFLKLWMEDPDGDFVEGFVGEIRKGLG